MLEPIGMFTTTSQTVIHYLLPRSLIVPPSRQLHVVCVLACVYVCVRASVYGPCRVCVYVSVFVRTSLCVFVVSVCV